MSKVWTVFNKSEDEKAVVCSLCEMQLTFTKDGSTSNMKKHIEKKHPEKYKELFLCATTGSGSNTSQPRQPSIKDCFQKMTTLKRDSPRYQSVTQGILMMICQDLQPLSFVEDEGFRALMSKLEPRYVIPSRSVFRNKLIPDLYDDVLLLVKQTVKEHLLSKGGAISITTDAWTARTASSYITYTMHLITSEFEMQSFNLGTFHFTEDHTAFNLKQHIYQILIYAGILKRTETTVGTETIPNPDDMMEIGSQSDTEGKSAHIWRLSLDVFILHDNIAYPASFRSCQHFIICLSLHV